MKRGGEKRGREEEREGERGKEEKVGKGKKEVREEEEDYGCTCRLKMAGKHLEQHGSKIGSE